jgi:hypothetical protein
MADTVEHVLDQDVLPSDSLSTAAKRANVWALVDDNNPGTPTTNRVNLHAFADSIIDDAVSDSSTNAIQNAAAKAYVDDAVSAAVAAREITRKVNGVRDAGFSLTAATTAAARGAVLVNALNSLPAGSTLEYFGSDDFELDNYLWTLKDNVTVNMPNVTLRKPVTSTSQYMLRIHRARNTQWYFGTVDINAPNAALTSRDTAFDLGGGYNNRLVVKEITGMRRPWSQWNAATAYSVGDGVYFGQTGVSGGNMQWHYCIQAHTNQPPVDTGNAYWTEKANGAVEMDAWFKWSSSTSYASGSIVWYAQSYWRATGTTTIGVAPGEGVANWVLADDYAPNGWEISVGRMHNPGMKGFQLGGDDTVLFNTHISQDVATDYNVPQTHTAFDYWRSGGKLTIKDVRLQDISAEAGTNNEVLNTLDLQNFTCILTKSRGTNNTTVKFQCSDYVKGQHVYILAPVQNARTGFKITVQTTRAYFSDSQFSGWIGTEGDVTYERCKFGHIDNTTLGQMFYALQAGRKLRLIDCDLYGATVGISIISDAGSTPSSTIFPTEDAYVDLDRVRCVNVTSLFSDMRRSDRIRMRDVTGYTELCPRLINIEHIANCEGFDKYHHYGIAKPIGGYSLAGSKVTNIGGGATKYWFCTASGYNVIGAKPAVGVAVTKGETYSNGTSIEVVYTSGLVGSTAVFRVYPLQSASTWVTV